MKNIAIDIDRIDFDKTKIESIQNTKAYQLKHIGTLRPHKGHTCFELNLATGEIKEAEYEQVDMSYNEAVIKNYELKRKLIKKEGCIYDTALNKKNFVKKVSKCLNKY